MSQFLHLPSAEISINSLNLKHSPHSSTQCPDSVKLDPSISHCSHVSSGPWKHYCVDCVISALQQDSSSYLKVALDRDPYWKVPSRLSRLTSRAATFGSASSMKLLVELGASTNGIELQEALLPDSSWPHSNHEDTLTRLKDVITPLHLATLHGHHSITSFLVKSQVDVNKIHTFLAPSCRHHFAAPTSLSSPFHILRNDTVIFSDPRNRTHPDSPPNSIVNQLSKYSKLESCPLISQKISIPIPHADTLSLYPISVTPLHCCAMCHSDIKGAQLATFLIQSGADPTIPTPDIRKETPLHFACAAGRSQVAAALIKSGKLDKSHINQRDGFGRTPLITAITHNAPIDIISLLLSNGADLSIHDDQGRFPLHCAVACNDPYIVHLLLYAGDDPHRLDGSGRTPLMIAVGHGYPKCVLTLLRCHSIPLDNSLRIIAQGYNHNIILNLLVNIGPSDFEEMAAIHIPSEPLSELQYSNSKSLLGLLSIDDLPLLEISSQEPSYFPQPYVAQNFFVTSHMIYWLDDIDIQADTPKFPNSLGSPEKAVDLLQSLSIESLKKQDQLWPDLLKLNVVEQYQQSFNQGMKSLAMDHFHTSEANHQDLPTMNSLYKLPVDVYASLQTHLQLIQTIEAPTKGKKKKKKKKNKKFRKDSPTRQLLRLKIGPNGSAASPVLCSHFVACGHRFMEIEEDEKVIRKDSLKSRISDSSILISPRSLELGAKIIPGTIGFTSASVDTLSIDSISPRTTQKSGKGGGKISSDLDLEALILDISADSSDPSSTVGLGIKTTSVKKKKKKKKKKKNVTIVVVEKDSTPVTVVPDTILNKKVTKPPKSTTNTSPSTEKVIPPKNQNQNPPKVKVDTSPTKVKVNRNNKVKTKPKVEKNLKPKTPTLPATKSKSKSKSPFKVVSISVSSPKQDQSANLNRKFTDPHPRKQDQNSVQPLVDSNRSNRNIKGSTKGSNPHESIYRSKARNTTKGSHSPPTTNTIKIGRNGSTKAAPSGKSRVQKNNSESSSNLFSRPSVGHGPGKTTWQDDAGQTSTSTSSDYILFPSQKSSDSSPSSHKDLTPAQFSLFNHASPDFASSLVQSGLISTSTDDNNSVASSSRNESLPHLMPLQKAISLGLFNFDSYIPPQPNQPNELYSTKPSSSHLSHTLGPQIPQSTSDSFLSQYNFPLTNEPSSFDIWGNPQHPSSTTSNTSKPPPENAPQSSQSQNPSLVLGSEDINSTWAWSSFDDPYSSKDDWPSM